MQTNTQTNALKFAAFLQEALCYVDSWTPTSINEGGCGVFARDLSDELTKMGIDHEIYAFYWASDKESEKFEKGLVNFINNGTKPENAGVDHAVIKIDCLYLDSHGIINPGLSLLRNKVKLTRDQLDNVINQEQNWNHIFDRSTESFIRKKLDEVFSKMEEFQPGCFKMPSEHDRVELTDYTVNQMKQRNPLSAIFG